MTKKITVLLVDDHSLVRRGFRRMLEDEPDMAVVGEAGDGEEALKLARELKPKVVVMDCALPKMNGLDATRQILEELPETAVLMLSMHSENTWVRQAIEAGAKGYILKNAMNLELGPAVRRVAEGETIFDPQVEPHPVLKGERSSGLTPRELEVLQMIVDGKSNKEIATRARPQRQHGCGPSRQHHERARHSQDCRACGLRHSRRIGKRPVNRRSFLQGMAGLASLPQMPVLRALGAAVGPAASPGFRLVDVTSSAGIPFQHNSGAFGGKFLPETLGSGCAFLDYDRDGWQDILLINGMDWPGHKQRHSTLRLYHNNGNGSFTDVTSRAGLDTEMYGMGVAVGDYDNDGFSDILVTCVGQNRLFHNTGKGTFIDVTSTSGLGKRLAFSTSALWFDYDRDGLLDLFVCNYVKWSPEHDVFCSLDGKHKSYCTPEAYRGETCWLFHNRGNGTFEDVTASSGIFDSSSKSLGVAMLDEGQSGWADLLVANDTQPNKLYRNQRNGAFKDAAVEAGLAFSSEGKARAGMGVDAADFTNSGHSGVAITNFDNEMTGLYAFGGKSYEDVAAQAGVGVASKNSLGFGCVFLDANLDGWLDLAVANGHIDETVRNIRGNVGYAQPAQLFLNNGKGHFRDFATETGGGFDQPKVGRGLAYADFDRDGDLDLLLTTNNGPAYLYRNDQLAGNRSIRFRLVGTKSNRDGIGATVRIISGGLSQSRMVKSGSSYLSQSELPVTFGLEKRDRVERAVIIWPSGRTEEFKNLAAGRCYECTEGKGLLPQDGY